VEGGEQATVRQDPGAAAGRVDRLALGVVVVAAVAVAVLLWRRYLPHWEQLWTDVIHDRNAHLDFGLQPASDLRALRFVDLLRDLNAFRTWPPLHDGVLVGGVLVVTGPNPRFAVVPSLVAFAGTAVIAFVLARRLMDRWGNLAGIVAATLVLVSPAMRAYSTDVMIESSGAFFTLLVLYAAVRVAQRPSLGAWRFLALALSALFFTKYNYWLIAVVAVVPLVWPLRHEWRRSALPVVPRWGVRFTVAALLLVGAANGFLGSTAIYTAMVAGWIAWASALWWSRTSGAAFLAANPAARMCFWWLTVPVLTWFCLPGKLQSFLWVAWPFTNEGEHSSSNPFGGIGSYTSAFVHDYQTGVAITVVVAALVAVAVVAQRRGRLLPGAGLVVLLLALALVTTLPHPNRKSRFLHSFAPVVWVLAGAGAAVAVGALGRRRVWVGAAAATALVVWQIPALAATAHAPEGGLQRGRPSALALTDAYLPHLADSTAPAIVSNVPLRFLARWTDQVRYDRATRPVTEIPGFDPAVRGSANRDALVSWLDSGAIDELVVVDLGPASPWYVEAPATAGLAQIPDLMRAQHAFVEVDRIRVGKGAWAGVWVPADRAGASP